MSLAAIGGLLGGSVLQGLGSYLGAESSRDAAEQQREYLERLRAENLKFAQGMTREEREASLRELARSRQEERQTTISNRLAAQEASLSTFGSPAYQAMSQFLVDTFANGIPESLAQDVSGRFRTAQASRGLVRGTAASKDEANVLANMAYQARKELLPQLRQMAFDPIQLEQAVRQMEIQDQTAVRQYSSAGLQQFLSTRGQAAQTAAQTFSPILSSNVQLGSQVPFSAVSPLGVGLGALGSSLGTAGALLAALTGKQGEE